MFVETVVLQQPIQILLRAINIFGSKGGSQAETSHFDVLFAFRRSLHLSLDGNVAGEPDQLGDHADSNASRDAFRSDLNIAVPARLKQAIDGGRGVRSMKR